MEDTQEKIQKSHADENDFTQGSILAKLLRFMLPVLGAQILQAMYGAVDILVVGRFGTTAGISGVSTGSSVVALVTFTITGLAMGITVLIGKYLGEKREDRIGKVIGGAVCFFAVLSVVLAAVMLIFARPLAVLMQAPEEAVELTAMYVRICGGGIFFIIAYNVISSIFRGLGNSRLPLIFVAIACAVNIIGDLLFVAVLDMNVAGAALATVMAQAVSVILSLVILKKQDLPFTVRREDICLNAEIGRFVKIGAPIAFQEVLTQLSFLALCAFINRLGLEQSSGYGVANKIVNFVMLIPGSLMQSMSAFVAQNVGAGKEKRAREALFTGMGVGMVLGVFTCIFVYFRGDLLAGIFSSDAAVVEQAALYLKGFAPEAVATAILFSLIGYFNGHGQTLFVMIQGLGQTFVVRLPMSYIMSSRPNASLTGIGLAAPCASAFGILLNVIYFGIYARKMKKERVE
ncbi:MAG: MATE family efflux transporter [Lachnospiraceae bacterium]|nr:MATE family efflux transporter [Lachnospiraceae bacterium]